MATSENANLSNAKWPGIKNRIFDFAFGAALNDATMQRAYSPTKSTAASKKTDGEKKKDAGLKRKMKDIITKNTKDIVQSFIDELLNGNLTGRKQFDDAFYTLVDQIADKLSEGILPGEYKMFGCDKEATEGCVGRFTFGNIQKLINMTIKYMFRVCYLDKEKRRYFVYCHCPMDRIMIEIVSQEYKSAVVKYSLEDEGNLLIQSPWRTKTGPSKITWSKIGFPNQESNEDFQNHKVYEDFQQMVRALAQKEHISPIEYDYMHWSAPSEDKEAQIQDSAG